MILSNDDVKFKNIIIYDTEEKNEYWIEVINHLVSRAKSNIEEEALVLELLKMGT